jgi:phosphonate transport system permease protein
MSGQAQPARKVVDTDLARLRASHPDVFASGGGTLFLRILIFVVLAGLFVYSIVRLEIEPQRFLRGLRSLGDFVVLMIPPTADSQAKFLLYLHAMGETIAIALLGTFMAAAVAFPLSFIASRNVMPVWPLRFLMRRTSDMARGIDQLIWALIWVGIVGLGPMAGVLAIAISDFGTFVKLFSEAIETADRKPAEGVRSAGGNSLQVLRYGIVPQVLPVIAGQALYLFESNVRSSTIIGIVGAGGIGLHLSEQIRTLEWQHVSLLIIMILVAVAITDFIATRLRRSIAGRSGEAALAQ